jgi:hypothetical protein
LLTASFNELEAVFEQDLFNHRAYPLHPLQNLPDQFEADYTLQ